MQLLRKIICLGLLVTIVIPLTGCVGVGREREDMKRNFKRVVQYDTRQMADDLTLLLQIRRPLRTSRWVMD